MPFQMTLAPGRNELPVTVIFSFPLPAATVPVPTGVRVGATLVEASAGKTNGPRFLTATNKIRGRRKSAVRATAERKSRDWTKCRLVVGNELIGTWAVSKN